MERENIIIQVFNENKLNCIREWNGKKIAHIYTNGKHIAKKKKKKVTHTHKNTPHTLTLFFIMENNCEIVKVFELFNSNVKTKQTYFFSFVHGLQPMNLSRTFLFHSKRKSIFYCKSTFTPVLIETKKIKYFSSEYKKKKLCS